MAADITRVDVSKNGEPWRSVTIEEGPRRGRVTITLGDTSGESHTYSHPANALCHLMASAFAKAWWHHGR
jgi:hypothetical protein